MSNHAFLAVWCKDFPEDRILERLGAFLGTVPFSATKPGFRHLIIRAVDSTETPVLEQDLRAVPLDPAGILEIAKDHLHNDSSFEVRAHWDLWEFDTQTARSEVGPRAMEISCQAQEYDGGFWREAGHFEVNLGFEHFFTGHAGLLGIRSGSNAPPQGPAEARFLEAMAWPENLRGYQEKTRENIRKLLDWNRQIEEALPVERIRLWSEGEENFEARIEEILAVR